MLKKAVALVYISLSLCSYVLAAPVNTCTLPGGNCAKFDIPGAFPGDFYIDFLATKIQWQENVYGAFSGTGSLSTASEISFSIGEQISESRYSLTVSPDGLSFLGADAGSYNSEINIWSIGTGEGWFDISTGDMYMDLPLLMSVDLNGLVGPDPLFTAFNVELSTLTPNGKAMILDPTDANWGILQLSNEGSTVAHNYETALIEKYYPGVVGPGHPGDPAVDVSFTILGLDPAVSAVPVPGAIWLFGSALVGLAGIKRKK